MRTAISAFRLALLLAGSMAISLACGRPTHAAFQPDPEPTQSRSSRPAPLPAMPATNSEPAPAPPSPSARTDPIRITISTPETHYELGASIELRVRYVNAGDQVLRIVEPQKTWELLLRVATRGSERSAAFGRLFTTNYGGIERTVVQDAAHVTLVPGATYAFTEDIGQRWPSLFEPGPCVVSVMDRSAGIESNTLAIDVEVTPESISRMLDVLAQSPPPRDPHRTSSADGMAVRNQQFAAGWVRRFYPELTVEIPPGDSAAESRNRASVQAARAFWRQNWNQPAMRKQIVELNRAVSSAGPDSKLPLR
jgi:hypothetical protein